MEYLVIDTESCTGKDRDGSLCSLGYVVCDENLNILKKEDVLINPLPKRFAVGDKKNAKRTGVTFAYEVEEFRKAPRFSERYHFLKNLFENRLVVGFSMTNDIKYLNDACDKYKLPRISFEFIDVQFIYQLLRPEQNSVGLKTLAEKYGLTYREHRSDDDAAATAMLLKAVLKENGLSFDAFVDKYGVKRGENSNRGYHMGFSDALNVEKFNLRRSRKIQSILYSEYVRRLPKFKNRAKVSFSAAVEKLNVNYVRTLVELLIEKGYSFTRDADTCSIYVFISEEENDKRREALRSMKKRKIEMIKLPDFEARIGYEKNLSFEKQDLDFLTDYYMTKSM